MADRASRIKLENSTGSLINPATEDTQLLILGNNATQIDDTSTTSVTYIGKASIGSSAASAVWQIQKIDESTSPTTIKWADGDSNFDNIFNNRTSLTYV
jgi:hypothetical protein